MEVVGEISMVQYAPMDNRNASPALEMVGAEGAAARDGASAAPGAGSAAAASHSAAPGAPSTRRGLVLITGAKLYFMVAGFAIELLLPRLFPADAKERLFAEYKVVVALLSVLSNVVVTVTIQSVARFVAQQTTPEGQGAVGRTALRLMIPLGAGIAGAFFLAAPLIATLERDPSLTPYLRIAAGILFSYAVYCVFVGMANGQQQFQKQAKLDMTFSTFKAVGVLSLAGLGFGVAGAMSGFLAAAVLILIVARFYVGLAKPQTTVATFSMADLGRFFGQIGVYTLLLNLLLSSGLLLLKRYTPDARLAGHYAAAQTLSVVCYQLLIAVIFVVFPLMSRATFEGDQEKTRRYVTTTVRYCLILGAAFVATLLAKPSGLVHLAYGGFGRAAEVLPYLGCAYLLFSLIAVMGAVLNGAGRTKRGLYLVGIPFGVLVVASIAVLPRVDDPLTVAAFIVLAAMAVGAIAGARFLAVEFGAKAPVLSVVRVGASLGVVAVLSRFLPELGKVGTLAEMVAGGVVYAICLFVFREIGRQDVNEVLGWRNRGKAA